MPYLTPEGLPEGDNCRPLYIPASTDWLAIVSGALTELTKRHNWEQFGTVTVEEAVERMELMLLAYYDGCDTCAIPGGGVVTQLDELGRWRMLDGGDWVVPYGDATIPSLPAIDAPTELERRCLAAKNAANVLKILYEELTDGWVAELTSAELITTMAEILTIRVGIWLGVLAGWQGLLLFGLFQIFYDMMEFVTADVWTSEFDEKLICMLLYHAGNVGDTVVFSFNAFREDLLLQTNWFEPSFSDIRLMAQIQYMLQFIGSEGLNHAGATTDIIDANCEDCTEGHCYIWDFTTSDGGWAIVNPPDRGEYSSGNGWLAHYNDEPPNNNVAVYIQFLTSSGGQISRLCITYDCVPGSGANLLALGVSGGNIINTTPGSGTDLVAEWNGLLSIDDLQIQLAPSSNAGNTGSGLIKQVRIEYPQDSTIGGIPTDNCEQGEEC